MEGRKPIIQPTHLIAGVWQYCEKYNFQKNVEAESLNRLATKINRDLKDDEFDIGLGYPTGSEVSMILLNVAKVRHIQDLANVYRTLNLDQV